MHFGLCRILVFYLNTLNITLQLWMHEMKLVSDWHHCEESMHERTHHWGIFWLLWIFFLQKIPAREQKVLSLIWMLVLWEVGVLWEFCREWEWTLKLFVVVEDESKKTYEIIHALLLYYNQFSLSSFCSRIDFGWNIRQRESISVK